MEEKVAIMLTEHEQNIKSLKRRMDKVEAMSDNINKLALSVERLAGSVSKVAESQKEAMGEHQKFSDRIESLEKQPLEAVRNLKNEIIRAISAAIAGGVIGYLISLL